MDEVKQPEKAIFHLPGLFEFYELYRLFLPLYFDQHPEYFYDDRTIGSLYGAPAGCPWDGGRAGFGDANAAEALQLTQHYGISARLTFSNSVLRQEHLQDKQCNRLCMAFAKAGAGVNGAIVHSPLLTGYLKEHYPELYLISSTTKVLTSFEALQQEMDDPDYHYVVPDFRLNRAFDRLAVLTEEQKAKAEFLCNECCYIGCTDRKQCYENVSRKNLGERVADHICRAPGGGEGYRFSAAMKNPAFISREDVSQVYRPMGFSHFKIEGRGLGSAMVLEFLLYYLTRPEYQLQVREAIYLDSMLDLF